MQVLEFSANQGSARSKILDVSLMKVIQKMKTINLRLDEGMQLEAWKKLFQYKETSCKYITLGKLCLGNFRRNDDKEGMGIESSCTKTTLLIKTLKSWQLPFSGRRNMEIKRVRPILRLGLVWRIRFPLQGTKRILWQSSIFLNKKRQIIP